MADIGEDKQVRFKYERLTAFCFLRGILGHVDSVREKLFLLEEDNGARGWGPELRVERRKPGSSGGCKWLRQDDGAVQFAAGVEQDGHGGNRELGWQQQRTVSNLHSMRDKDVNSIPQRSHGYNSRGPGIRINEPINQPINRPGVEPLDKGKEIMVEAVNYDKRINVELMHRMEKERLEENSRTMIALNSHYPTDVDDQEMETDGPSKPRSSYWAHSMAVPPPSVLVPSRPPPKPPMKHGASNDLLSLGIGFVLCG